MFVLSGLQRNQRKTGYKQQFDPWFFNQQGPFKQHSFQFLFQGLPGLKGQSGEAGLQGAFGLPGPKVTTCLPHISTVLEESNISKKVLVTVGWGGPRNLSEK